MSAPGRHTAPNTRAAQRGALRGFTLVELLVGLATGLLLVSMAVTWAAWQAGQHRDALLHARLVHDLNASAALVGTALLHAGEDPAPLDTARAAAAQPPAHDLPGVQALPDGLRFLQHSHAAPATWSERAWRVQAGSMHWRVHAQASWQAMTDPQVWRLSHAAWQAHTHTTPVPYDCQPACTQATPPSGCAWALQQRLVQVHLRAQAVARATLTHQVAHSQHLPNDTLALQCS